MVRPGRVPVNPVVLLNTLGGPSPTYLRWLMFSKREGMEPVIAYNATDDLVNRISPAVIIMVRTMYTMQPCRVEWCEHYCSGDDCTTCGKHPDHYQQRGEEYHLPRLK